MIMRILGMLSSSFRGLIIVKVIMKNWTTEIVKVRTLAKANMRIIAIIKARMEVEIIGILMA